MSIIRLTYSGNIYDAAPAGQQDFPLTTSSGQPIPYLSADHIHVYSSADDGTTWNELARPSDWDFATTAGTTVRLTNGIAAGTWIRVQRFTPYQDLWTTFQEGSQLTAGQLNVGEEFSMYVDQELFDLSGSSWSTGNQTITEADQREGNWVSDDTHIATTGALSARFDVFTQATQPADPPNGEIRQPGKLWINTTTARVSYWDTTLQDWILIDAGITDAPADGSQYARKNNAWSVVSSTSGIPEAPSDGNQYTRKNKAWSINNGITEAPNDGKEYTRKNKAWSIASTGIPDAPANGNQYARENNAWSIVNTGIPDAPANGNQYARENNAWSIVNTGIPDAPADGNQYTRENNAWSINSGITDAPADGNQYSRKNNAWSIVSGGGGGGIPEAPQDSKTYGRNNASWVVVSSSGGGIVYKGTIDATAPAPGNPQSGDFYVNIGVGTVDASWTGIAGTTVSGGERLAYNGTDWEILPSESNWKRGTNSLYPSVAGDSVLVGGVLPGLPAVAIESNGDGVFTGKLTAGEGYFVGNVGLGTANPQAALDINAPGSTVPFIASINGAEKARIDLAGNFGIGTNNPAQLLDVNGDALINGLTVGRGAGSDSTNTAVGRDALISNVGGTDNTAVGLNALSSNTAGYQNTAVGEDALKANIGGISNTALGIDALQGNTGSYNTAAGGFALLNNVTGDNNTAIGRLAGRYIEGSNNTILGAYEGTAADATLNSTVIIAAGATERLRIDSVGNAGIGTTNPQTKLDVNGTVRATVFDIESLPALP